MAIPATGAFSGTPASIIERTAAHRRHRSRYRWIREFQRRCESYKESLLGTGSTGIARARRDRHDRFRAGRDAGFTSPTLERREVVVQHEFFEMLAEQGVDPLLVGSRPEVVTTRACVSPRVNIADHVSAAELQFPGDRPNVFQAAAIDPPLFVLTNPSEGTFFFGALRRRPLMSFPSRETRASASSTPLRFSLRDFLVAVEFLRNFNRFVELAAREFLDAVSQRESGTARGTWRFCFPISRRISSCKSNSG